MPDSLLDEPEQPASEPVDGQHFAAEAVRTDAFVSAVNPFTGTVNAANAVAVTLRYKTRSARITLYVIAALFPFWGIFLPYALHSIAATYFVAFDISQLALFFIGCASFCFVVFSLLACLDNKVIVAPDTFTLPLSFLREAGWRRRLSWSDLKSVVYKSGKKPEQSCLQFRFGKAVVSFQTAALTKEDLRKLVFAAQTNCMIAEAKNEEEQSSSFTALWHEEYAARCTATVFVPLAPGALLSSENDSITIIGQVTSGGFSAVYIGYLADGRRVIVKEAVTPSRAVPEIAAKALEQFSREAEILERLDHPRICKILRHFSHDNRHYIILEQVQGTDLRRFIQDAGRQHEEIVLRWALEVADVLEYLHEMEPPVVHRDLSPDNLMFTTGGGIAIVDFGAANALVSQTTGTVVGKQNYMAPEQFKGHTSCLSDIYSLGATMHFLLTGLEPVPLTVSRPRGANLQVSQATDELVSACTALSDIDRPASARDVSTKINAILHSTRSVAAVNL